MVEVDAEKEKKEILLKYKSLLRVSRAEYSKEDKKMIRKAFDMALEAHKDTRRKSGEPYIYHPIAVANIASKEIGLGATSVICALLHDVVEDTDYTLTDISNMFGEKIAKIIDGLTKISGIFDQTISIQAENFRKMLLTLSDDVRVILIKLADRLHNMRTLGSMPKEKQLEIASETIYLYAPLAHRLGLYAIKSELEDLAMKYTEPEIYNNISQKLRDSETERAAFITRFIYPIRKTINEQDIKYTILARTKSIRSIWDKMKKKEIPFEEVFDLFAIRIVIDVPNETEKADCWRVYSIVTDIYRPNPDRLRDWISTPKGNGYESLHTTVMSNAGKWVEVQIRSKRMDEIAEKGYAAHWKYKDANSSDSGLDEWLKKIREMLQNMDSNALDFLDDFKLNLFSEEVFVFTPKGELKNMPIGSTALDFAYNIHSQVGNNCIGAKVNLKLVPLSHKLKSGDQIEIITSSKQFPREDWLGYVITARAKDRIKNALKEDKKKIADEGKLILERKFKQVKLDFNNITINKLMAFHKISNTLDLYYEVANGKIGIKEIKAFTQENEKGKWLRYLTRRFITTKAPKEKPESIIKQEQEEINKKETLVIGENMDNLDYTLSTCCNPISGDDVFGFVTINEGIKIHRINCPNAVQLRSKYAYRIIKAKWTDKESIAFLAGIQIKGIDELGIINNITRLISDELNLNIRSIKVETNDGTFEGDLKIYIKDTNRLNQLINNIKKIKGVQKVQRINGNA
ncbi:MAG: RelA/SpoT family protein [Bacteroidetes bacterium CG2_30_32_10]|nr:MAG: RelA/SpoT family protein [Bacteroidetes bacterium CG2_30_32_10]